MNDEMNCLKMQVRSIKEDGSLVLDLSPTQLLNTKITYGDLLNVRIDKDIDLRIPFVSQLASAGFLGPCLCDFEMQHKELTLKLHSGNFAKSIGGEIGSKVEIRLLKKDNGLFNKVAELHYEEAQKNEETNLVYSNFRMINFRQFKKNVIYRSCSPINYKFSPGRVACADSLCKDKQIKTVINLADTYEDVEKYIKSFGRERCPYYSELFYSGGVYCAKMSQSFFNDDSVSVIAVILRIILECQQPYLIHCNEGKDRTGLFFALMECLMHCKNSDIIDDYMQSYVNFYQLKKNCEEYLFLEKILPVRFLYVLSHMECINTIPLEWESSKADVQQDDYYDAAYSFLIKKVHIKHDEIAKLQSILGTN